MSSCNLLQLFNCSPLSNVTARRSELVNYICSEACLKLAQVSAIRHQASILTGILSITYEKETLLLQKYF